MEKNEVFERVREIIEEVSGIDREEIKLEDSIMEDIGLSSLEVLNVISSVERSFSIKIPSSVLDEIDTVDELVDTIIDKMG